MRSGIWRTSSTTVRERRSGCSSCRFPSRRHRRRAWVADTNSPGDVILPKDSWKTIVKFVAGKNATGTVWMDDVMFYGRAGQWAGQHWGSNLEYPTGWYYWMPPIGGNDGVLENGFENTVVTTEAAHSGLYSLKFDMPFSRQPHDGFVGMKRVSLGTDVMARRYRASDSMAEGERTWYRIRRHCIRGRGRWVHAAVVRQRREQRRVRRAAGERLHVAVPGSDIVRLDCRTRWM